MTTNILYLIAQTSFQSYIVKSTDSGATWSPLKIPNSAAYPVSRYPNGADPQFITTDPKISGVLYAVNSGYIFKSVDFGVTWIVLSSGVDSNVVGTFSDVVRLDVDPNNSQVLYTSAFSSSYTLSPLCKGTPAGGECGLYKSIDGGNTWIGLGLPSAGADSLSIDPVSGAIYVGSVLTGTTGTVFKSTDGSTTFTPLKNGIGTLGPYVRAFSHIGNSTTGSSIGRLRRHLDQRYGAPPLSLGLAANLQEQHSGHFI